MLPLIANASDIALNGSQPGTTTVSAKVGSSPVPEFGQERSKTVSHKVEDRDSLLKVYEDYGARIISSERQAKQASTGIACNRQ
jgi:hypothetical protein